MLQKTYNLFIAYHGSYDSSGSYPIASQLYDYLTSRGLSVFFFPASGRDLYKANIIDAMKSRTFILVCNENIHTLPNGRIDPSFHYELSTEIDAFYALTQLGDGTSVSDSKVLVCGDYTGKRMQGDETRLHELFANRTHTFLNNQNPEETFEILFQWVSKRSGKNSAASSWTSSQTTDEIKEVFAKRSAMSQICNLTQMVASAKSIKCLGISNSELTRKMNPDAITYALNNGATIEMLFLDPDCDYTRQREEEEHLRPNKIRDITLDNIEYALDIKKDLTQEQQERFRLLSYNMLPRMNIMIIDSNIILQYYANAVAGMSNPCFLIERKTVSPLYDFCMSTYESIRKGCSEITEI